MKYISLVVLIFSSIIASAKTLSPEQALDRLNIIKTRSLGQDLNLKYTLNDSENTPALYVFDRSSNAGYVIASADDSSAPLLGYSENGSFDPYNIPPQLNYWLSEYGRQIEFMRNNDYAPYESSANAEMSEWKAISPLLESKWNQGAPYNLYCYTIAADGTETKSVTGCVATSMAQVMYYFKYPEIGKGEISYKHGDSGTYSMNFGQQAFNWDEMQPTYYPDSYNTEQADAVAYLMKACGYSVRMDYGKGESGASGTAIAGALINYFGYNDDIVIQTRKFQTYDDWASLIYKNLSKVGPVVYNGSALDGGHSFVCDGYDGNGYFHFNWGWGGMSDGYYLLDALNPDEYGIGGAAGGFNLGQQVILGISPKENNLFSHQVMQFGSVSGKINNAELSLELVNADDPGFQYIDPLDINITFGLEVQNSNNLQEESRYFESDKKNLSAKEGTFFKWNDVGLSLNLDDLNLNEGDEYDVTICTLITINNNSKWVPVVPNPGKSNMVTVKKTSDGYEVINYSPDNIEITDFKVVSTTIYQNLPIKFSASFKNESDSPLTRNYSAVFFNKEGTKCFTTENYSVNVDENSTLNQEWTSVQWYKENDATDVTEATEFTLKLYDNWEATYVEGIEVPVTVMPEPKDSKVESYLSVVGATKEGDIYVIDSSDFEVSIMVKVIEGFFNATINLGIEVPLSNGEYYTLMHRHFDAIPDLSAGEEQVLTMSMTLDNPEPDKIYRLQAWSNGDGFGEHIDIKFNISDSSVVKIPQDSSGIFKVYDINGQYLLSTPDRSKLQELPTGIYIINGHKVAL